ncbi:DNA repair protein dds20 mei5 [Colletotrichum plurivorum]|uniref:DNA repair protein dds20 mei5 n=1 Tax=Colletotrichum plurivorum TaxID=2175906 RepID=A0A8H6KLD3_9PEZI|nr:DNA repair protein dds20 mei5 [Colletotrichum plurivorum]
MSTPAKRRRIDTANETLRKPFKSPGVVRGRNLDTARGTGQKSTPAEPTNSAQDVVDPTSTPAATRQSSALLTPAKQLSKPAHRPFSTPRPRRGVSQFPLRTTTPLANRLPRKTGPLTTPTGIRVAREVEGREEIIRQAERIRGRGEASGAGTEETDQELVVLIDKWRAASRQAAEEVFEASRDRVQSMGGMRAWRRTRMEERRSFMEVMMEEERPRDRDCGPGDEAEADPSPAGGVGAEDDGDDEEDENGEEDEDEGFTLGTMLKSMGIDFDIIGYDEDTGWWRDG